MWHSIWHVIYHSVRGPQAPQSRQSRDTDSPPRPRESQQAERPLSRPSPGPEPNLLRHSAVCQILFGMVILPLDVLPVVAPQKSHPKCNQIQPLSFLGSFICLCVCVRMLNRSLSFRWLLSLPSDFGGIFCALCVCVFERVYVCNVVSWHIMLSNHI